MNAARRTGSPVSRDVSIESTDLVALKDSEDVVRVRQKVRERAIDMGFTLVEQTKIVTAASELGRNTVQYGGGGQARVCVVTSGVRRGLLLEFADQGPGIDDIELALKDGYTTGSGLGLGLSGARRLCDEFEIESQPGHGTRVTIVRWKPF